MSAARTQANNTIPYQLIRVNAKNLRENCKWLEMFEDVGIVLFCVSLIEHDEYSVDSSWEPINKMLESKRLFKSIATHPTFEETNFLLLLTKIDLLGEKIEQVPLTHCEWFQDFNPLVTKSSRSSSSSNVSPLAQRAFHYIAVKFKRLFMDLTGRKLYVCPVAALDSVIVDSALSYAREIIAWEEDKLGLSLDRLLRVLKMSKVIAILLRMEIRRYCFAFLILTVTIQ